MKKLYALAMAVAVTIPAHAVWLTPAEALQRVNQGLPTLTSLASLRTATAPARTVKAVGSDRDALYIYNLPDGAVALSGSSLTRAVVGRLDHSVAAGEELPANLAYWLGEMARQIEYAETAGLDATRMTALASRLTVDPLITAHWGQDEPYNRRAPMLYDEGMPDFGIEPTEVRAVTGCVATSIAQVCYRHKYPSTGKGTVDYATSQGHYVQDMTELHFDYSKMLEEYAEGKYTDEQADAVAELMLGCGMAVNMHYMIGMSGSNEEAAYAGLTNHLGFSRGALLYDHDYLPVSDWDDVIYNELAAGRPVLYYGGNQFGQGHAWVCDGYDSAEGLFHFDFGWNGGGNGWFTPSLIDPSPWNTGYGNLRFVFNQAIIVGVEPPQGDDLRRPHLKYSDGFSVETATMALPGKISVNAGSIIMPTEEWEPLKGCSGLRISREDGTGEDIYAEGPSLDGMLPSQGPWWHSVDIPSLPDGKYRVSPVFRGADGQWFPCSVKQEKAPFACMTVTGGIAHVANASAPQLRVTVVKFDNPSDAAGRLWFRAVIQGTVTIRNDGDTDSYTTLHIRLKDKNGNLLHNVSSDEYELGRLVIPAGSEITEQFSIGMSNYSVYLGDYITEQDCSFAYIIPKEWDYGEISDYYPAHYAGEPEYDATLNYAGTLENLRFRDGLDPENLDREDIGFAGTYTNGDVLADLFSVIKIYDMTDGDDEYITEATSAERLFLLPGDTFDWSYTMSIPILEGGHTYRFEHGYNTWYLASVTGRIRPDDAGAAESVSADATPMATVVSEQWYTPAGTAVNPATAVPGLYIVRIRHADGTLTTTKRLVN